MSRQRQKGLSRPRDSDPPKRLLPHPQAPINKGASWRQSKVARHKKEKKSQLTMPHQHGLLCAPVLTEGPSWGQWVPHGAKDSPPSKDSAHTWERTSGSPPGREVRVGPGWLHSETTRQ